ncbi:MAG: ERCC4 domain-containing protein [Acetobacteraceae bacterium]|nr:ERCC4 domain-containing protein [Acetobacteraceae bacterium]
MAGEKTLEEIFLNETGTRFSATIIIDVQEKLPFTFDGFTMRANRGSRLKGVYTVTRSLKTGDYSLEGFENDVAIERKSLTDLYSTLKHRREQFENELSRLSAMKFAAVVVEADWRQILGLWPEYYERLVMMINRLLEGRIGQVLGFFNADKETEKVWGEKPPRYLSPVTVHRCIIAYQERFPRVHWWFCPERWFAERTTFRLLERFWRDHYRSQEEHCTGRTGCLLPGM